MKRPSTGSSDVGKPLQETPRLLAETLSAGTAQTPEYSPDRLGFGNTSCFARVLYGSSVTVGSSVTDRTIGHWMNVLFFLETLTQLNGILANIFRFPIELGNKLNWSQMRLGISVTIDAPSHGQFLCLVHLLHLVNSTVAANATDTASDVSGVIEVNKIRETVNANPLDRLSRSPTFVNGLELRAFWKNRSVGRSSVCPLGL